MRTFRSILVGAMRVRWLTIAVTLACFAASLLALPYVPRQFFPASDRPELTVDLTLPQNASIYASEDSVGQARRDAQGRSRRRQLEHLCRTRRDPFLPAARRQARQRLFLASRRDRQGRAGARPAALEAREGAGRAIAERRRPRFSARARAAGRLAGAISGQRTGRRGSAGDRAQARPGDGRKRQSEAGQFRLDGALARGQGQDRPGSGPASRLELADAGRDAERRHVRDADHPGSRRHLSRQCRRPGERRAARVAFDLAFAAAAAPRRAHGPLKPDRDLRFRSGISADLAARPGPDADRPGRRQQRRDAGRRGRLARAGDRQARGEPARAATTSPPAARSRRAPSRRLRCSRSCPRRCS